MESSIDGIFEALHVEEDENNRNNLITTLNYLLPGVLIEALNIIEAKKITKYNQREFPFRSVWFSENGVVNLDLWTCTCSKFLNAIIIHNGNPAARWKCACNHLIAAYLLNEQYSFLDIYQNETRSLTTDEYIWLPFNTKPTP